MRATQAERVLALVNQRLLLHTKLAPTIRAAMLRAPFSVQIAEQVRQRRDLLAEQVAAQFAPEAARLDRARADELLASIDGFCSFETIEMMRVRRGFTLTRTRRALVAGTTALIAGSDQL